MHTTTPRTVSSKVSSTNKGRPQAPGLRAYGPSDGTHSFRHRLTARERSTLDRALDLVGRHLRDGPVFENSDAVKAYLNLRLGAEQSEHFGVLFLDSQNRAIAYECMFRGTLTQTSVYPREVAVAALRHHAAAVILAHNHPSGTVQPSRADEHLTATLKATLAMVDVRLLDHIIVAGGRALSMAESGLV